MSQVTGSVLPARCVCWHLFNRNAASCPGYLWRSMREGANGFSVLNLKRSVQTAFVAVLGKTKLQFIICLLIGILKYGGKKFKQHLDSWQWKKQKISSPLLPKLSKYNGSYIITSVTVFILIGIILWASFEMDCPQKWGMFWACWP